MTQFRCVASRDASQSKLFAWKFTQNIINQHRQCSLTAWSSDPSSRQPCTTRRSPSTPRDRPVRREQLPSITPRSLSRITVSLVESERCARRVYTDIYVRNFRSPLVAAVQVLLHLCASDTRIHFHCGSQSNIPRAILRGRQRRTEKLPQRD